MTAPGEARPDAARREVLGVAGGGAVNLAGALFSQVAFFGSVLLVSRALGRASMGRYSQAFAFLALLGLLSLSGFRAGLTRYVAVHLADGDDGRLRGTVRLGLGLSAAAACLMGAALGAASGWLAGSAFGDAGLAVPLRLVALALPASVFMDAALSATQGFKTMKAYALVGMVFEPGLRVALTAVALVAGAGLGGVMVALVASHWAAALAAAVALRRLMGHRTAPPRYIPRELFGFSAVSWMASLASTGLIWADTILLGLYRSSAEVGVYQVATRMVLLASFVMLPVNASFAPRIADLFRRGEMDGLRRTYVAATGWILRLSLPAFAVCMVFPGELLSLFGTGFAAGAAVTVVLAWGKLVDSATGPCGLMLNMSGRPGLSLADNAGVLVLNVALNLWLIPAHGIVGAAVAWAVSLAAVNVVRVSQVWRLLGMLPFDAAVAKALAAGLAAAAVGIAVRQAGTGLAALAVGATAMALTYLAVVAALGISPDDRMVLQVVARRLRPGHSSP